MDLVIPTYGRAGNQATLGQIVSTGLPVTLVVQEREFQQYATISPYNPLVHIRVLPDHIRTIAPTRQWIIENVGESDRICMLDDDLIFYKRRDDDRTKLRDITPHELHAAFCEMDELLSPINAHIGFAAREGANRCTDTYIQNTRIMRVLGYNREALLSNGVRFDQMEVMEDFHVALSLLEKRCSNWVLNSYAHNQAGSGKAGGCSHFRTPELHAENARKLAELHPGVVKVVQKTTKGAWGGGTRTDVVIQWKKAYGSKC